MHVFKESPAAEGQWEKEVLGALIAVKRGDASARLPVTWPGDYGRMAEAFNDVVELNTRLATELERLSRVVGTEGRIKQRATLGDVSGFWRDAVTCVNWLVDDLVHPNNEVARVINALSDGDLSKFM